MGKNKGRTAPAPTGRGVGGRGIAKASHNSSSSALGAAIAAARKSSAPASLHLQRLADDAIEDDDSVVERLLDLVRETFADGESDSIPLTTLGDKVRTLAVRRALHGDIRQVKEKFGGWEAFLRAQSAGEFSVVAGNVRVQKPREASAMQTQEQLHEKTEAPSRVEVEEMSLAAARL